MRKGFYLLILLFFVIISNPIVFAQTSSSNTLSSTDKSNCLGYKSSDNTITSDQRVCLSVDNNMIARSYYLGPKDVISFFVYDSPEFNQEKVMIQPDGKISVSPLGNINVAGMTVDELHDILVQKLKFYLNDPRVTVKLVKTKAFIVYVSGAVMKAGSYEINTDTSQEFITTEIVLERKTPLLSNVLVAAGGVSYDADLENVVISNDFDNTKIRVNLLELVEKGDSKQDIYLTAGDRVHVSKLPTAFAVDEEKYKRYMSSTISPDKVPVKVLGFVNNPGLIMLDTKQSLTLNSAISSAGGYYKDARYPPKKVYISRSDGNGHMVTKVVNPQVSDVTLMPKDIVYIPEKPRPMIGKFFDYAARVITPINAVASSYNNWALMFNPDRYAVQVSN